MKSKLWNWR